MEIRLLDIPEEGLAVELVEPVEKLDGLGEGIKALSEAKARFSLKKVGATVFLEGEVEGNLEFICSRCGKPYPVAVKTGLQLDLNPVDTLGKEEDHELGSDNLDVEFYSGDVIDLSGVLKEQLILQEPMKPLCGEGCRGLCQYCGQDLNESECSCEAPTGHPGLTGLGDMFKDKEKK